MTGASKRAQRKKNKAMAKSQGLPARAGMRAQKQPAYSANRILASSNSTWKSLSDKAMDHASTMFKQAIKRPKKRPAR